MTVGVDSAVIVDRHVRWQLLTSAEQAELTACYPRQAGIDPPAAGVFGNDVDPQFEQWLDGAYLSRHATDTLADDPY